MAYLNNISFRPDDIRDLRDLIITTLWTDEDFRKYVNLKPAMNGENIGFVGDLGEVGKKGGNCNPTFASASLPNSQKVWTLGGWEIPIEICFEEIEATIAEWSMNTGTDAQDLTNTDFMNIILYPAIEKAVRRMFWRIAWFGDTAADTIANGGVLTNGTDKTLFTMCDGLFKRLFAIGTADANRVTAIAANAQTTYALQKSALLTSGVATGIFDAMKMNAPAQVASNPNAIILCTRSLADALAYDVKQTYKTIMPWTTVFEGFDIAEYDGVKVARVSIWDELINAFENTGTKWNKPHRAVYSDIENLLVGVRTKRRNIETPDGSQTIPDLFEGFDVWFDKNTRTNKVYASGKIGTLVREDNKVQLAY